MKKEKLTERAQKYIQKGYLDKAIAEYKEIVAMDPQDVSTRLRLGDLCVKTGKKEDAIKEYSEVGKIHAQKGFYLKAIAVYKQVMKLDEANLDVHHKLADLYTKQRLIVDAIAEYSHILGVFEKKGKNAEALELLKKMADIDAENVGLKLKLADTHKKLGYMEDALEEYLRAGNKFMGQSKWDKAEKILSDLYFSYPKETRVVEVLAELYKKTGEGSKFLKYARELLEVYAQGKNEEKAKGIAREILGVSPHDERAGDFLGETKVSEERVLEEAEKPEEKEGLKEIAEKAQGCAPVIEEPKEIVTPPSFKEEVFSAGEEFFEVPLPPEEPPEGPPEELETLEPVEMLDEIPEEALTEEVLEEKEENLPAPPEKAAEEVKEEVYLPSEPREEAPIEHSKNAWDEELVDLSKELGIEEALEQLVGNWPMDEKKETVEEIKTAMGEQLEREDVATHHNMGIAYMEMGLYDDAVREFKISMQDGSFEFDAAVRLGLCSMSTGSPGDAIGYYLKALKVEGRSDEERKGLFYELGLAYDRAGSTDEALEMFRSVYEMDHGYREAADKVKDLTGAEEAYIPKDDDVIEIELL